MNSNAPLDCAFFQLSPRRTRCDLFVSVDGKTEKLASGFLKPFLTHLKVAVEQASHDSHLINLEVGRRENAAMWFNKGTVERFVRFVSTPEALELVSTFDAEMTQLEGARKMYSQGSRDQFPGESEAKSAAAADATKKELLRAIDVRLIAVKQDLATAFARASAAGFNSDSVSELLLFADQFGSIRLSEACKSFLSLTQRRPEMISHDEPLQLPAIHPPWKSFNVANLRSSGSDMSIDEPEVEQNEPDRPSISHHGDGHWHILNPLQPQQQAVTESTASFIQQMKPDSHHLLEKKMIKSDDLAFSAASSAKSAEHTGGSKRLTVQDRINLFENKQKELTATPNVIAGSFGGPITGRLAGTRGEHRRNPSDASVEKLVLRRWSGASDMSFDLNSNSTTSSIDRKESGSTTGTPTSSANLPLQTISRKSNNDDNGLMEASKSSALFSSKTSMVANSSSAFSSSQDHDRTFPNGETTSRDAVTEDDIALLSIEPPGLTEDEEQLTHMSSPVESLEHGGMSDQAASQRSTKYFPNSRGVAISREAAASQTNSRSASEDLVEDQIMTQIPSRASLALAVPFERKKQASFLVQSREQIEVDDITVKTEPVSMTQFKAFPGKMQVAGTKSLSFSNSQVQFKPSKGKKDDISSKNDSGHSETNGSSSNEVQEAKHISLAAQLVPSKVYSAKAQQESVSAGSKFSCKTSETNKLQGRRGDEVVYTAGSSAQPFQIRKISQGSEASPILLGESHTARLTKDNQKLNDVLHLKSDELEKVFTEHKLKNNGDQMASKQRKKTLLDHATETLKKRSAKSPLKQKFEKSLLRQDSSSHVEIDSGLSEMIENFDLCDIKMQKMGSDSPTDFPRGKFYGKYMQRRDAKLSQECGTKRAQKEAKMKAMQDSLELSHAEMKTRLAGFSDGHNLAYAYRRAEKMKSFNARSTPKVKEQTLEPLTGDGDDDDQELSESLIGNQSQKPLSFKSLSSTALSSVNPTSKHMLNSTNPKSCNRGQTESPASQSVPKFCDSKNENIKPSIVSKATARGQPNNFTRSKSSNDDSEFLKEDKSRCSSMRKNSITSAELKDSFSFNSEKVLHNVHLNGEFSEYPKKGNGVNRGYGAARGKSRSSMAPEHLRNKEKSEEIVSPKEDSLDKAFDGDEFRRAFVEGNNMIMDLSTNSDGEKERHSQEFEYGNGDLMRPLSHLDDFTTTFSKFNSSRNAEDSAEESSGSLNSHACHYKREASDIFTSVDFSTDCPSWNSHSMSQIMDSEAARMRKKWGNAQIPVVSTNASQQSRREVTKGFKRLLKFGRKGRGADYLVNDWVSASTASEGDDDTEDGRDLLHRPSDDFRKSRMGFNLTSYDGFNDHDIFPEQAHSLCSSIPDPPANFRLRDDHLSGSSLKAPRSFFSISSFRSKAGDSNKPR